MSIEVFPSGATLSGGDSQSFEARQNGQIVDGVQWSIIPPYKGKIDASTGTYHSPYPPIFFSKEVTVVARLESAPKEYGTASIQLSAAHTWIVAIIAYMIVWAAILTYWGHGAWCKVFEPTGLAARTEPARPPGPSGSTASSSPEPSGAAGASGTAAPGTSGASSIGPSGSTGPSSTGPSGAAGTSSAAPSGAAGSSASGPTGPTGSSSPAPGSASGNAGGNDASPTPDCYPALLELVLIFGAAGSLLHGLRSLYGYVGNKQFESNWVPFYLARPFEGGLLALLTVLVFQGPLLGDTQPKIDLTKAASVCAVAGLVGLFTDKALRKLEQVLDAILSPPADSRGGKLTTQAALTPLIARLTPEKLPPGSAAQDIQITGDQFEAEAKVFVNDSPRPTVLQSPKSLKFTLTADDLSKPATLKITVKGKAGTASNDLTLTVG